MNGTGVLREQPHTQVHNTRTSFKSISMNDRVRVSWSVAKFGLEDGNNTLRALRAYLVIVSHSSTAYCAVATFFQVYADHGQSRSTAHRDLRMLLRTDLFAIRTTEAQPRLIRRSIFTIMKTVGVSPMGFFTLTAEEIFGSIPAFRQALRAGVGFSHGRTVDEGVTISQVGLSKLTHTSVRQIQRMIIHQKIQVRENYAEIVIPTEHGVNPRVFLVRRYGPRLAPAVYHRVRIRNTYYVTREGISSLASFSEQEGVAAAEYLRLSPERGDKVLRQQFYDTLPSVDQVHALVAQVDVDIFVGVDRVGAKEVGHYVRFAVGESYSTEDIRATLQRIIHYERPMRAEHTCHNAQKCRMSDLS